MEFTAEFFFNQFGQDAIDQWEIALSEHGLPDNYKEEEYWDLCVLLDSNPPLETDSIDKE